MCSDKTSDLYSDMCSGRAPLCRPHQQKSQRLEEVVAEVVRGGGGGGDGSGGPERR